MNKLCFNFVCYFCLIIRASYLDFRTFANTQRRGLYRRKKIAHSVQEDSSSCGVLTCKFAEAYLQKQSLLFPVDSVSVRTYRKTIWEELLNAADGADELCFRCGERDEPFSRSRKNNWVSMRNYIISNIIYILARQLKKNISGYCI